MPWLLLLLRLTAIVARRVKLRNVVLGLVILVCSQDALLRRDWLLGLHRRRRVPPLRGWLPVSGGSNDNRMLNLVESMRVHAGSDEQEEFGNEQEERQNQDADEDRLVTVGLALRRNSVAVVGIAAVIPVACSLDKYDGEHDGDGKGGEPQAQGDADVGAGVDAALPAMAETGDEFGNAPDSCDDELQQ